MLEQLKQSVTDSSISYFQSQTNNIIIWYVVFIVILMASLVYFMFFAMNRMREVVWNTNLLLKIIPHHSLDKKDAILIKKFLANWFWF